ncbi:MAG: DUF1669 domain-containing protein [Endomicrobiales bacterium]|nr:DUF1669 domain-containing protein [Endomicrobiales bacterium]
MEFFKAANFKKCLVFAALSLFLFSPGILAETKVLFSPNGGIQKEIIKRVTESQNTVDVMCFHFTSRTLAKALVRAKKRGVRVRLLLDESKSGERYSMYEYLKDSGINLKLSSGFDRGIMHNKTAVFDSKSVLTGSYNWTGSAERFNRENAVFIDDIQAVHEFQKEFEKLWRNAKQ